MVKKIIHLKNKIVILISFDYNTNDIAYLNALENHLPRLVDLFEPDFMFYLAGVDVLKQTNLVGWDCLWRVVKLEIGLFNFVRNRIFQYLRLKR